MSLWKGSQNINFTDLYDISHQIIYKLRFWIRGGNIGEGGKKTLMINRVWKPYAALL